MAIEKGEVVPGENAAGVVKNFLEEVIEKD